MESSRKKQDVSETTTPSQEETSDLLEQGKKVARDLYDSGMNRVNEAEQNIKEYSDQIMDKVKEKPMISMLLAAGIGYILSLFRGSKKE